MQENVQNIVEVKGLTKSYSDFTLNNINLSIKPGCVVGLIGGNGAGKTTTIKALLGITEIDSGTIKILGQQISPNGAQVNSVKDRIGVVFDTCAFPSESRIKDVELIGRMAYSNWDRHGFYALCSRFELSKTKKVKKLSRGMGMKLTLAFALSHHPSLLILDEATAGLDPIARADILDILRNFMEEDGHSILLSTHITTDLDKIADRVVCMDKGNIVFDVNKDDICDIAGIAKCRASDIERIKEARANATTQSTTTPNAAAQNTTTPNAATQMRMIHNQYGTDLLVPDRMAFKKAYPDIPCDKADIENYMTLFLKGETI